MIRDKKSVTNLHRSLKIVILIKSIIISSLITVSWPFCTASAEEAERAPEQFVVGTLNLPPFSFRTADDQWRGIGMDLWKTVAEELNISFTVKEYKSIEEILRAVGDKEVDIIPVTVVSAANEQLVDLTGSIAGQDCLLPSTGQKVDIAGCVSLSTFSPGSFF
jgi:ABC-type amino acid transport substrate-binding protein